MNDPIKVLVIDDEPDMLSLFETMLSEAGYILATANSGQEGVEIARKRTFDVIVIDIKMPDMDGIEVLKAVKQLDSDVGVILITGFASLETAVDALRLGADDYLMKPFEDFDRDVTKVIEKTAERHRLIKENKELTAKINEANQNLKKSNTNLKKMVARMTTLQQMSQLVNNCSDIEMILSIAEDALVSNFDVASYMLLLANEDGWHSAVKSSGVDPLQANDFRVQPGVGSIGEALLKGIPSLVSGDEVVLSFLNEQQPPTFLVTPLVAGGELIGSLIIFQLIDGRDFDEETMNLFSIISSQISAPLALAKLQEKKISN